MLDTMRALRSKDKLVAVHVVIAALVMASFTLNP